MEEARSHRAQLVLLPEGIRAEWMAAEGVALPVGVRLYFTLLRYLAVLMAACSLLSVPGLVLAGFGSGVLPDDRDSLGLYRLTFGNIGYNRNSATFLTDSQCRGGVGGAAGGAAGAGAGLICLHLGEWEVTLRSAALLLSAAEAAQVVLFLVFVALLQARCDDLDRIGGRVGGGADGERRVSVTDFAASVEGVPGDVTAVELVSHFSSLYQLALIDQQSRPAVEGAFPVQPLPESLPYEDYEYAGFDDYENDGIGDRAKEGVDDGRGFVLNSALVGSWLVDCVLHRRIGSVLAKLRRKETVFEEFLGGAR